MDESYVLLYPELERTHFWWLIRQRMIRDLIVAMRHPDLRVLDVGCGSGATLEAISDVAGEMTGVEIDPLAVPPGGQMSERIRIGTLEQQEFGSGTFDVVLMLDVLEHVEEPRELVREALRVIVPGGRLIVTVPAFQMLWSEHDEINRHFRRYRRSELAGLIESEGFAVERASYFFASLFLPKLVAAGLHLDQAAGARADGLAHRLAAKVVDLEYSAWRRGARFALPFGTSVVCVASA